MPQRCFLEGIPMHKATFVLAGIAFASICCYSQDSQSLGDVARQVRAQKQQQAGQTKDGAVKAGDDSKQQSSVPTETSGPKARRVITNDDSPSSQDRTPVISAKADDPSSRFPENSAKHEEQGEHWKAQVQSQKEQISSLQNEIAQLSSSIRYAGANCVANCAKWNEHQERKQEQIETMKSQLEEQKHRLEEMQEEARKQGFGSSIYDP